MKHIFTGILIFLFSLSIFAGDGYKIKVKIEGFQTDTLLLGYHYGGKQYIKDTVTRGNDDWFVFSGEEEMPGGMYLIVMPPDNRFLEILLSENQQHFSVKTAYDDPAANVSFTNSPDNTRFYEYLHFLADKRPRAEALNKELAATEDAAKKEALQAQIQQITNEVEAFQDKLIASHPNSLSAAIIKATRSTPMPEYTGSEEEVQRKKWRFTVDHFFDNINLKDERLARTSFLFQRIDYFINKLTIQHPDSISKAIDVVLSQMNPKGENFKFYLVHFLNTYAKSKIVGMDAVYVHIVNKYYKPGMAYWTDAETMKKILENAKTLEPLLIGKIAPDITMQKKDGSKINLHSVQSPYTVLFFWDPDCGHCKKISPKMVEFYKDFKDRGVKIFSICTKFTDEVPECWKTVEERDFSDFINVVDPYHRSKYKIIYDIKSTPQIYILDENKEIIMKRIGAEQLSEVMEQLIKIDKESGGTK